MVVSVKLLIVILFIIIAFVFDLKEHRIPNLLNLIGVIIGFLYNIFNLGVDGLLFSLKGLCFGFSLLFILYIINAVGAGDVKLFAALGALMGSDFVLYLFVVTMFLTGIFAIIFLFIKNRNNFGVTKRGFIGIQLASRYLFSDIIKGNISRTYFPLMVFVAPAVLIVIAMIY